MKIKAEEIENESRNLEGMSPQLAFECGAKWAIEKTESDNKEDAKNIINDYTIEVSLGKKSDKQCYRVFFNDEFTKKEASELVDAIKILTT